MAHNLTKKTWPFLIRYFGVVLILGGCATLPETVYDLATQSSVPTKKLLPYLSNHRVIFVGEAHDSDVDHIMQLEIIRQLRESGRPVAVGLEMFPAKLQPILDGWVNGKINEEQFTKAFYDTWTVPYAYYENIFMYAHERGIRLIGLNLSKKRFRKISKYGIGAELLRTLKSLKFRSCGQEVEYANTMRAYLSNLNHTGNFNRMCDSQRFREAFMAKRIVDFLDSSKDTTMVVLVGSAHAQKNAIPEMLRRHGKQDNLVLLPDNFSDLMQSMLTKRGSDFVWQ